MEEESCRQGLASTHYKHNDDDGNQTEDVREDGNNSFTEYLVDGFDVIDRTSGLQFRSESYRKSQF